MKDFFQTVGVILGLASGVVVSSCGHLPKSSKLNAVPAVTIRIVKTKPSVWTLQYDLDRPVEALYFEQQMHRFRSSEWKPAGEEWILGEVSGKEAVRRKDGAKFDTVSFTFGPSERRFYDLYAFSLPYSDGAHALYSGHFLVHGGWETTFRLTPLAGERVDVIGASSTSELSWRSPSRLDEYGAFLYFGNTPTVATRYFDALVDPGLPAWLRKRVFDTLPKALALLEKGTGITPDKRIFVMVNRWPKPIDRQRFMGTASDRWISVDLQGIEWRTPSAAAEEKFFGLLAHEASHLYTSQVRRDFLRVAWMNEGGADYFAALLSRSLSVMTDKQFEERLTRALEDCLKFRTAGQSRLSAPNPKGSSGYYYQCGLVVHAAVAQLLEQSEPRRSFLEFWGKLLSESRSTRSNYSEKEYFELARRWTGSSEVDFLESFVGSSGSDAAGDDARLTRILKGRGGR